MKWAALILWLATAAGGFLMLGIWLKNDGIAQARLQGARIRPPLLFSHFLLAATGLVLWIIYLANDSDTLKWIAFALLLLVALLGFTMLAIWLSRRDTTRREDAVTEDSPPAEQHF